MKTFKTIFFSLPENMNKQKVSTVIRTPGQTQVFSERNSEKANHSAKNPSWFPSWPSDVMTIWAIPTVLTHVASFSPKQWQMRAACWEKVLAIPIIFSMYDAFAQRVPQYYACYLRCSIEKNLNVRCTRYSQCSFTKN